MAFFPDSLAGLPGASPLVAGTIQKRQEKLMQSLYPPTQPNLPQGVAGTQAPSLQSLFTAPPVTGLGGDMPRGAQLLGAQQPSFSVPPPTPSRGSIKYSFDGQPLTEYKPEQPLAPPPQEQLSAFGQNYEPTRGTFSEAPVIQQTPEQQKAAADAERAYDLNARGADYVAQQDLADAKAKMEQARAEAFTNAYKNGQIPELSTGAPIKVEVPDGKGGTVVRYITRQEALAGSQGGVQGQGGFQKPAGKIPTQIAQRIEAAHAALDSADKIKAELARPEVQKALGPLAGRVTSFTRLAGNLPPEAARLAGMIHGYMLNTMGVHGMRSAEEAEKLNKEIGDFKMTPQAIQAAIEGLNEIPNYYASLAPSTRQEQMGQETTTQPGQSSTQQPVDLSKLRQKYNY